jgi:Holliday junction resolvase RusA-like endonuclease
MPTSTTDYENRVRLVGQSAVVRSPWNPPETAVFTIVMHVFRASRRGDWDNFAKAICDGLKGVAWKDDRLVEAACVYLYVSKTNPRVEITITSREPLVE